MSALLDQSVKCEDSLNFRVQNVLKKKKKLLVHSSKVYICLFFVCVG